MEGTRKVREGDVERWSFQSPPRHKLLDILHDIVVDLVAVHIYQLGDTDELSWKWKSINLQNKLEN